MSRKERRHVWRERPAPDPDRTGVYQPFPGTDAETFIQWKGTEVCMDLHCPCGRDSHFDADFAYFVRCGGCDAVYETGTQVKMRRLADGEEPAGRVTEPLPDEDDEPLPPPRPAEIRWAAGGPNYPTLQASGFVTVETPPSEQSMTGFPKDDSL